MKEEYEELLFARHHKILAKVKSRGLAVGNGWFNIIDLLCAGLQSVTDGGGPQVVAVQIKQKFGGLRFYVDTHSRAQGVLIEQAERMAERTCEMCGAPGEQISLDGWVVVTCPEHRNAFKDKAGRPRPIRVFVDMDDVLTDFRPAFLAARSAEPSMQWPQAKPGFFSSLQPLPNAVAGMQVLDAMAGIDVHILTAPSTRNPKSYTEKRLWIEQHLGYRFVKRLHISPRKDLFRGDVLIDDNLKGKGQENFEGDLLRFGSESCPNWPEAVVRVLIHRGADPWPAPIRARLTNQDVRERLGTPPRLHEGLCCQSLKLMSWLLALPLAEVMQLIGAKRSDVIEWGKSGVISLPWAGRIYNMAHLFDRVLIVMQADVEKTRRWLCEPLPVLHGKTPLGYLQENDSMKELNKIIDKIVEGVS